MGLRAVAGITTVVTTNIDRCPFRRPHRPADVTTTGYSRADLQAFPVSAHAAARKRTTDKRV